MKNYKIFFLNKDNQQKKENFAINYKEKEKFAILRRNCDICGLFSFYIVYLGCINEVLRKGYIPIVDLMSFPNTYNNFTPSNNSNPWEYFFGQPFGYTIEEVLKKKNIEYFQCTPDKERPNENSIYYNKSSIDFWHRFGIKYIPLKREIIRESIRIMKKLFKGSNNVLGVKIRGTDYIALKIRGHPIPPKIEDVINDVKKMNIKYNYDWIFFASEDEVIKKRFITKFKNKIKYLNPNIKINYNYTKKQFITREINGNLEYTKNYVINIYILSRCKDIVMSRGSGGTGIILLTNGFRNSLIYNIGEY